MNKRGILRISVVLAISLVLAVDGQSSDDSPGFFLKLAKNVPRIGRRNDAEYASFFLKNSKQTPRLERDASNPFPANDALMSWLSGGDPQPIKRKLLNLVPLATVEREYSVVQPVNSNTLIELIETDAIESENVKFVHWKDFDRALQQDADLYNKVISLGRKPDRSLREDLGIAGHTSLFANAKNGVDQQMYPYLYGRDPMQYSNHLTN